MSSATLTNPLPQSPLYQLLDTPTSGRGVFASTNISTNTLILSTSLPNTPSLNQPQLDTSPLAWLIQRPYRKEACANCFAYNRGRDWKVKVLSRDCGVVFCCDPCRDAWVIRNGELGMQAWEALEVGTKGMLKRNASASSSGTGLDIDMHDVDCSDGGEHGDGSSVGRQQGPSDKDISLAWDSASLLAEVVINARTKERPSKNERRVLRNVVERGGDADLMYYLLTAVMAAYNAASSQKREEDTGELDPSTSMNNTNGDLTNDQTRSTSSPLESTRVSSTSAPSPTAHSTSPTTSPPTHHPIQTLLAPLFTLTSTSSAYTAAHTSLPLYTSSYLYLTSLLPLQLTPYLTPTLAHNLNTRAAHNAFSIRPSSTTTISPTTTEELNTSDGPDSGEFLGWAVYPSASFFNHSCTPNLAKARTGRTYEFRASRDILASEELSISYLGGEEAVLDVKERRQRLHGEWGFVCACVKCTSETREET